MPKYASAEARREQRRKNYAQSRPPADTPRRFWGAEEDKAILTRTVGARTGLTDRELAAALNRSAQAVQIRRSRIRPVSTP